MKIDCFPFFNEKELLELRINLLYDKVDRFIITEGDHTHSGKPKKMNLLSILRDLSIPLDKILYVPVALPSINDTSDHWLRERMQRNAAAKFIKKDDIAFVSDCDEILNPEHVDYLFNIKKDQPKSILRTPLVFLCGRADLRVYDTNGIPMSWNTPYLVSGQQLEKYTLSQIREDHAWRRHELQYPDIYVTENGSMKELGWHFTWMGNLERLQLKEASYCHSGEYKVSTDYVAKDGSSDPLGRSDHVLKKYQDETLHSTILKDKSIREFLLP
jgi:beta-1,4-mannosyl-glycoprotein beta-1,4-N-acetylglucosaminyltransferase